PAHRKSLAITSSSSHTVPDAHTAASLVPPAPSSAPSATASPSPANTPSTPSASSPASPSPAPLPLPDGHNVTAIGDSVMLGAVAGPEQRDPGGRGPGPSQRRPAGLERRRIGASRVALERRDPPAARWRGCLPRSHPRRPPARRVTLHMNRTGRALFPPILLAV